MADGQIPTAVCPGAALQPLRGGTACGAAPLWPLPATAVLQHGMPRRRLPSPRRLRVRALLAAAAAAGGGGGRPRRAPGPRTSGVAAAAVGPTGSGHEQFGGICAECDMRRCIAASPSLLFVAHAARTCCKQKAQMLVKNQMGFGECTCMYHAVFASGKVCLWVLCR